MINPGHTSLRTGTTTIGKKPVRAYNCREYVTLSFKLQYQRNTDTLDFKVSNWFSRLIVHSFFDIDLTRFVYIDLLCEFPERTLRESFKCYLDRSSTKQTLVLFEPLLMSLFQSKGPRLGTVTVLWITKNFTTVLDNRSGMCQCFFLLGDISTFRDNGVWGVTGC